MREKKSYVASFTGRVSSEELLDRVPADWAAMVAGGRGVVRATGSYDPVFPDGTDRVPYAVEGTFCLEVTADYPDWSYTDALASTAFAVALERLHNFDDLAVVEAGPIGEGSL